jgi:hypothetical protein
MQSTVKNVGTYALGIVWCIAAIALPVILIFGALWVGEKILPWLMLLSILALGVCIVILGPLAVFRPTRPWAGLGYYVASYVFGLTGWFMGLLLTWILWGGFAVLIGLVVLGIGVVPIAMLATLFKGMWAELGLLILTITLTFGFRILGMHLAESGD